MAFYGAGGGTCAAYQALIETPDIPLRPQLLSAEKLARLLQQQGDVAGARRTREQWIAPFLARDPASLPGPERGLRADLLREREDG